jgi:hypothetical protein
MIIINSYAFSSVIPDFTPDDVAASYSTSNEYFAVVHTNNYFQVQGINQTITLKATISNPDGRLQYKVMNTVPVSELSENPVDVGWSSLASNGTTTISNDQYFVFGGYLVTNTFSEFTVDITNSSDGDGAITTIDCLVDNT